MRFVAQTQVMPLDGAHEVVELGHHFDAREAPSSDDKCQELAPQCRVLLDIRSTMASQSVRNGIAFSIMPGMP